MPKAFLSHSSSQKFFVEEISKELNSHTILDSKSFEFGMLNAEEIINLIDHSELFVVCLSEEALQSDWVNQELEKAYLNLQEGKLERIYPMIIDNKINHTDNRIPEWMKKSYNIQTITRPNKAVRLIKSRLREISWSKHPKLQMRDKLFVGRNKELAKVEERLDDIALDTPSVLIASGLPKIGRKKFLEKALIKTNTIYRESIEYPSISLDTRESIEDFIIKIYDLGISSKIEFPSFMEVSQNEKIKIACKLIHDIKLANEIIFIEDFGAIILPDGSFAPWFWSILAELKPSKLSEQVLFCIASRFRAKPSAILNYEDVFQININELTKNERLGLLKRLIQIYEININKDEFLEVGSLLNGFPEQVFYTVNYIERTSIKDVLSNPYSIKEYHKEIFNRVIKEVEKDKSYKSVLSILVEFDFISFELITSILEEEVPEEIINEVIKDLDFHSLIDFIGSRKEYFKLNEGVKDFLLRAGYSISNKRREVIKKHIEEFVKNDDLANQDISDYFYSLRGALLNDYKLQNKLLLPSHYLKTMIYLYERERNYKDVIILADRVLENEKKIDTAISREIKYWLCLSLARERDKRFKQEVQYFQEDSDYYFLFGFYYRLIGKLEFALDNLTEALKQRPKFSRAQRELVQVLLGLENYEQAYNHAKFNYESDKSNPFHIQSYYDCLIHKDDPVTNKELLTSLLNELGNIESRKAKEMHQVAQADYELFVNGNSAKAIETIDQALSIYNYSLYLLGRKFTIAEKGKNLRQMAQVIEEYKGKGKDFSLNEKNQLVIMKAKYLAHTNQLPSAINLINSSLKFYPEHSKDNLIKYLNNISKY